MKGLNVLFSVLLSSTLFFSVSVSTHAISNPEKLVVVSRQNPADILPAVTLSNFIDSDILILDKENDNDIPKNKDLIVVGGEEALTSDLFKDNNYTRISGNDRYETSLAVLKYAGSIKKIPRVNLISGKSYADGVIVSSKKDLSVLVSSDTKINEKVKSALEDLDVGNIYVVGGKIVVSDYTLNYFGAKRISGADRYETSKIFARENKNGYISSTSYSFYKNVIDAKSSIGKDKGFLLVKPDSKSTIVSFRGGNKARKELNNFLIKDDKKIIGVFEEIDKNAELDSSKLDKILPTNTAFTTEVKTKQGRLYIADDSNGEFLHIAVSKDGNFPKEYLLKDSSLANKIKETINKSVFDEYHI